MPGFRTRWPGIAGLLLLSGCGTFGHVSETPLPTPTGTPAELHQAHLRQLAHIDRFFLQARIGIRSDGKGSTGTTRWRHDAAGDDISMLSPVGGTLAKIIIDANGVTLTRNDGKVLQATDAETLVQQQLGWRLPLGGLPDWALGRPTRRLVNEVEWDGIGRITRLKQDHWEIEYLEYMESAGYRLPRKINLHSDRLSLRLVIERWGELPPAETKSAMQP